MELARLAVDSGGDTASIQRTLDPTVVPVPDIEGSKEDRCELTRTPYGRLFINEEINSYLESLFEMIVARGPSVGVNVSLSRFDFFHGHVFLARDSGRLGILFHAKEYPAYDKEVFPCNMGYCQIGTNVSYDDSMNLRNILWLPPLASNSSNEWLAPGVLVVLDARPTGVIYKDLIPEYVQIARTLYEDDFGDVAFDVNYLNTGVSKDIDPVADSVLTCMLQAVAVPVLGNVCHVFMHGLNRVQIYGEVLENRMENKPLITVSNHVAAMDDPLVIAALLPPSVILDAQNLRWTLCATDQCFRNPVTSAFFKHVKVLPVSRGDGIYQKGMDMAISKLNRGGWVHIFPEGSRSRDGGKTMGCIKRGIGRLILDADNLPIVIAFVHTGMQDIMPVGAKLPRIGKTVTFLVGDPIEFDDLLAAGEKDNMPRGKLYDAVSTRIGDRLQMLKAQVDRLAVQEALQSQHYHDYVAERAAGIVQHVDWEALGMDNYMTIGEDHASPPRQEPSGEQPLVEKQMEENSQDRYFRLGFSRESGIVSRIRGYMGSTELMLFSARCLVANSRVKENFENIQEIAPLKAWNNFWMPLYESQVLITSFSEVDKDEYLDPRTVQVARVDHVKQVCKDVRPARDEELPSAFVEEYRSAMDAEIMKYVSETYPKGICSVYCTKGKDVEEPGFDFELVVVISAARHSPQNFCNGYWRSIWNIEFKDEIQSVEVRGEMQVGAHYFEEGNVQLDAEHEYKDTTLIQSPDDSAISLVNIIRHHETEYLASLQTSYLKLPDTTFKDLRRKLPVTRTLFPWHNTAQFSLTRDIEKELGIGK